MRKILIGFLAGFLGIAGSPGSLMAEEEEHESEAYPAKAGPQERGMQQGQQEPPMLSEKFLEKLRERLELSQDQSSKIRSILEGSKPVMKRKWEEIRGLREKMKDLNKELKALMRDAHERIRSELNNEQREKFDEFKMQWQRRQKDRRMKEGWEQQEDPRRFPPEMWQEGASSRGKEGKDKSKD